MSSANTLYKEWKATTDEQEDFKKKKKSLELLIISLKKRKLEIKQECYYDTFQAQKTDLKKVGAL